MRFKCIVMDLGHRVARWYSWLECSRLINKMCMKDMKMKRRCETIKYKALV